MYKIPIQSLYNIFNHNNRKLTNIEKAYQFITNNIPGLNIILDINTINSLFTLLPSLNGEYLEEESLKDSIINELNHFGFKPKIDPNLIHIGKPVINALYVTVNDFIHKLNEQNSKFIIKCKKILEEDFVGILKLQYNLIQFFDIVIFGGCDRFRNKTKLLTQNVVDDYIFKYHRNGGIIMLLHCLVYSKLLPIFKKISDLLGFIEQVTYTDDIIYDKIQLNESSRKDEIISYPFAIGDTINILNTHINAKFDPKYTVLYNKKLNHHYYCENLDENIANCEIGHRPDLLELEQKLFYNIICHLYLRRGH